MNRIIRLIRNIARQARVVSAEKAAAKGGILARSVGALSVAALLLTVGHCLCPAIRRQPGSRSGHCQHPCRRTDADHPNQQPRRHGLVQLQHS